MNILNDSTSLLVICLSLFTIVFNVGLAIFILKKLPASKEVAVEAVSRNTSKGSLPVEEKLTCPNHPSEPTVNACLICEEVFCEKCIVEHEGLSFCREHFKIYAGQKWKQVTDLKVLPDQPELQMPLWNFKRKIWSEQNTPSFILTHYKINVDDDFIESYVQLFIKESDYELQKEVIDNLVPVTQIPIENSP